MFTGIIQQQGIIKSKVSIGGGIRFGIETGKLFQQLSIGDSIAINGVCLTVTKKRKPIIEVEAVEETLKKTTLDTFHTGRKINCELPLRPTDFIGGHFVLGHCDCVGDVLGVKKRSTSWMFEVSYPARFANLVILHGSITIDGVSLTIAELSKTSVTLSIIPHTYENTTFHTLKAGAQVNVEFDVLGKYVVGVQK